MGLAMTAAPRQLLEYRYESSEEKGVSDAIQVASQWLQEIFKELWWPDASIRHLVHHGNGVSCDAVKIDYRAGDSAGPLTITVYQTLFHIVVTVGIDPADKPNPLRFGRRLFNQADRLRLMVSSREGTRAMGYQDSTDVPYRDCDWLDTMKWWSDGNLMGFEMLKRTGPGQGTVVRPELEANLKWFARFE
jgi:hypothetical protein